MLKKIIPKLPDDFEAKSFNKSTSNLSNNNTNNQTQESEKELEVKSEDKPMDRIFEDQVFAIVGKLSKYVITFDMWCMLIKKKKNWHDVP